MEEMFLYRFALNHKGYLLVPVRLLNSEMQPLGCKIVVYDPFGYQVGDTQSAQMVQTFEAAWSVGKTWVDRDIHQWQTSDIMGDAVKFVLRQVGAIAA